MAPIEIQNMVSAAPFLAFRICLSDGTTYDVDNPHMVIPGNRTIHVGIPATPGDLLADRVVKIDVIHITQLVPLSSPPLPHGNGQVGN